MFQHSLFIFFTTLPFAFCLLDTLNEQQLVHLFGTASKASVPQYWIDVPSKGFDAKGLYYTINIDGESYRFRLSKHKHLISPGFHSVIANGDIQEPFQMDTSCIYQGESDSHNGTSIALVGCGPKTRGLIMLNGEHFLVHPHFANFSYSHIIHKRSLRDHKEDCAFNARDDPFPEDRLMTSIFGGVAEQLAIMTEHELVVELAVFIDDALWMHFQKLYNADADAELQKFVLAVVNNIDALYQHSSIEPKIRVKITRFEVMKMSPMQMSRNLHSSGDVDRLLDVFCKYQNALNPTEDTNPHHWDHALLFSGYDLYRGSMRTIAGYAAVKGMCTQKRSCTINEGLDFGSVFVVAHEMGHSLGMYHDGDNRCDLRCCIMSPSVGSGKTSWSECSVRELNAFVMQLGQRGRPQNCLIDGTNPLNDPPLNIPSGQEFTLDEQCAFFHGECWRHELKEGQDLSDVCKMVWCGNGEGLIRSAHPALEGTFCGEQKWCIEGKCVKANSARETPKVDGAWSSWNDVGLSSCSNGCIPCSIAGQIRVRRSTRHCSKPYPNNGGHDCPGDSARAIRCHDERCSGATVDEYATQECTRQRDRDTASVLNLTGRGYQYREDLCKIWCVLPGDRIRTISNFPDGTPCGRDRYCVKGQCRPLLCGGRAIVESGAECPLRALMDSKGSFDDKTIVLVDDKLLSHSSQANTIYGNWSNWSSWSECTAIHCRQLGIRIRQRSCSGGVCPGTSRQRSSCFVACASPHVVATSRNHDSSRSIPNAKNAFHTTSVHNTRMVRITNTPRRVGLSHSANIPHDHISRILPHGTNMIFATSAQQIANMSRNTNASHGTGSWNSTTISHRSTEVPTTRSTIHPDSTKAVHGASTPHRANVPHTTQVPQGTAARHTTSVRHSANAPRNHGIDTPHSDNGVHTTKLPHSTSVLNTSNVSQSTTASSMTTQSLSWSTWSECSASCGRGLQIRIKGCLSCRSPVKERRICVKKACESQWMEWGEWSACDATCGNAKRRRQRECDGSTCRGLGVSIIQCKVPPCATVPTATAVGFLPHIRQSVSTWNAWSAWSKCTVTCGSGVSRRVRKCTSNLQCVGISSHIRKCNTYPCSHTAART